MKKTLIEKKSENLLSLSARDECICLLKIAKKKYLDLFEIFDQQEIDDFFKTRRDFLRFPNVINEKNLQNELNNLKYDSISDFLSQLKNLLPDLRLSNKVINYLRQDFVNNAKWLLKNLNKFASIMADNLLNLFLIQKQSRKNTNKKGVETLFVARYFLYYKTQDEIYVRAPLIFLPVEINNDRNEIFSTSEWKINEKLFTLLAKDAGREFDFNEKYDLDELINWINNATNSKFEIESRSLYQDYGREEYIEYLNHNKYVIKDEVILGNFGVDDAILYREINDLVQNEPDFDPFTDTSINFLNKNSLIEQEINDKSLLMLNNRLDIYQRYSIRSSLHQDTIIYGPPGTGKSQTISNLIINLLLQNKSALIVSEKMTALNVILKRLKNLNIFFLRLAHYDNKNSFYDIFKSLKDSLQNDWFYDNYNSAADLEKEKIILQKINEKQYDVDLKNYFKKIIELRKTNNLDFEQVQQSFVLAKKLGSKYTVLKNNTALMSFFQKLLKELNRLNINPEIFFNEYFNFLKENKIEEIENFENASYLVKDLLLKRPNLLALFDDQNTKQKVNEIKKLIENGSLTKDDISYIRSNFFNLNDLIRQLNSFVNFLPEKLIEKSFVDVDAFYRVTNKLDDDKNLNYKFDLFLKNEDYLQDLRGLKKLTFRNNKFDVNIRQYLLFVHNNLSNLNENIKVCIKYYDLLFSDAAWYVYIPELSNENFIDYYNNNFMLFPISFAKSFLENGLNFEDFKEFMQIHTYQENLKNNLSLMSKEILNDVYSKDTLEYEILTKDVSKLLFDLMIIRVRRKLASLPLKEKKEMQVILATGSLSKRPEIFRFINLHQKLLREIFPIWLGTPENIARNLPATKNSFNYGIFDEASQVYLEKIYSIVYRTQIKIVAGDDKQIQPMSYFSSIEEYDPDDNYELAYNTDAAKSLLEKAQSLSWNEFMLKNHYRSDSEQLITFSNKEFYNNELDFASYNTELNRSAIRVFDVDGTFNKNGVNVAEAQKVIELLKEYYAKYDSIIVITANISQMNYINELILKDDLLSTLDDERISIINLENIQGEEADLVIFDVTYAKRENSSILPSNFGPINFSNGKYRINVAITRAKKEMFVVKSFKASEIMNESRNESIEILKKYLSYVEKISLTTSALTIEDNEDIQYKQNNSSNYLYEDLFMLQFTNLANGRNIEKNYLIGSQCVDYVFFNKTKNKIDLIVFIDDFDKDLTLSSWLEKIDFQRYLESRGYKTYRINLFEWILKYQEILIQMQQILSKE